MATTSGRTTRINRALDPLEGQTPPAWLVTRIATLTGDDPVVYADLGHTDTDDGTRQLLAVVMTAHRLVHVTAELAGDKQVHTWVLPLHRLSEAEAAGTAKAWKRFADGDDTVSDTAVSWILTFTDDSRQVQLPLPNSKQPSLERVRFAIETAMAQSFNPTPDNGPTTR